MASFLEECIQRIRERATFHLVKGKTHLVNKSKYPFDKKFIPIMGQLIEDQRSGGQAFESGNRSIVFPYRDKWFKAKAIGIPSGISQPFLVGDKIYSYRLIDDPDIGFDVVAWGFHDNPQHELNWMRIAYECGLPAPEPVGWAELKNLYGFSVLDRRELFDLLSRGGLSRRSVDSAVGLVGLRARGRQ